MSVQVSPGLTLVCFAVPQESKPFQKLVRGRADVQVLLTGMGRRNAERALKKALTVWRPCQIYSCGFAGGLNPELKIGDVVFSSGASPHIVERLSSRAKAVRFTCVAQVAITSVDKSELRARTGADAVEMESGIIDRICREVGIPCTTLRAVSDAADEDLPLDFNALLTPEQKLSSGKLALAILRAPQKIPALLRLGRNSNIAAERLADVLAGLI